MLWLDNNIKKVGNRRNNNKDNEVVFYAPKNDIPRKRKNVAIVLEKGRNLESIFY